MDTSDQAPATQLHALQERIKKLENMLRQLTELDSCSHAVARDFSGKTCAEFMTWQQGVSHPGCLYCQAQALLGESK